MKALLLAILFSFLLCPASAAPAPDVTLSASNDAGFIDVSATLPGSRDWLAESGPAIGPAGGNFLPRECNEPPAPWQTVASLALSPEHMPVRDMRQQALRALPAQAIVPALVPEPSGIVMLLCGLVVLFLAPRADRPDTFSSDAAHPPSPR